MRQAEPGDAARAGAASNLETMLVLQMTAALVANPPTELTIINVADEAGTVTLSGQVSSPTLRVMAEEIAARYPGVSRTVNDLEIVSPDAPQDR
jgi:osmotically-inducible protein OsmY